MDIKFFSLGLVSLLISYLIYFYLIKDEQQSSQESNWEGVTGKNYVGLWGSVILCIICGVALIFKSLFS